METRSEIEPESCVVVDTRGVRIFIPRHRLEEPAVVAAINDMNAALYGVVPPPRMITVKVFYERSEWQSFLGNREPATIHKLLPGTRIDFSDAVKMAGLWPNVCHNGTHRVTYSYKDGDGKGCSGILGAGGDSVEALNGMEFRIVDLRAEAKLHTFLIVVNGAARYVKAHPEHPTHKTILSYRQIVALACPEAPDSYPSITWSTPNGSDKAILKSGESIAIEEGLRFSVYHTGNDA